MVFNGDPRDDEVGERERKQQNRKQENSQIVRAILWNVL
jgi:hypothetical protein